MANNRASGKAFEWPDPPLDPSGFPVNRLTIGWWNSEGSPRCLEVRAMREELYSACLEEMRLKGSLGRSYDPGCDHRVKWASQWLEVAERSRRQVDPDVEAVAALIFNPYPELCGKDRAAGELQPQP